MIRNAHRIILILMLALMMVSGSFIVSMADDTNVDNTASPDVATEESSDVEETPAVSEPEPVSEEPEITEDTSSPAVQEETTAVDSPQEIVQEETSSTPSTADNSSTESEPSDTATLRILSSQAADANTETEPEAEAEAEDEVYEGKEAEWKYHGTSEKGVFWKLKEHKDPTCTEDGYDIYAIWCSACEKYNDAAEVKTVSHHHLGHDMGEWVEVKEPTKTEDGLQERHCLRDGCDHKEGEALHYGEYEFVSDDEEYDETSSTYEPFEEPRVLGDFSGHDESSYSGPTYGRYTNSVTDVVGMVLDNEKPEEIVKDDSVASPILPSSKQEADTVTSNGMTEHLLLIIDVVLALGLIAGLGALWKLGVVRF